MRADDETLVAMARLTDNPDWHKFLDWLDQVVEEGTRRAVVADSEIAVRRAQGVVTEIEEISHQARNARVLARQRQESSSV